MKKKQSLARVGGGHPENPLQQARIKAGVSQEEIAEELSCDTRTIQRYEAGKQSPPQSALVKMKSCYSCDIADLFREEERWGAGGETRRKDVPDKTQISAQPATFLSPFTFWKLLIFFAGYRQEMPVTEIMIFPDGNAYYVCPKCRMTVEREFMSFCDRCGQRLGWKDYKKVRKIYPGQNHTEHT